MARCVSFMTLLALTSLFSALEAYENFVAFSKNVTLREDVPVGTTVLHLTDFVNVSQNFNEEEENGTSWTVNVTTGDDFGQFGVDVVNLTLFVAASLDYELNPRYNLSLELTNPLGRSFHHVNLVVTVVDVPGYPPYYNKRCETPVLPDSGATEDYMVMSSSGGTFEVVLSNGSKLEYPDFLPPWRYEAVNATMYGDCSLRYCVVLAELASDAWIFLPALEVLHRGRIEFQCHGRQSKDKASFTMLDISLDGNLPPLAQSGQCKMVEGARYFMLIEVNEIWHTPSYWVQCDAVIRLVHLTVPVKTIHQFSITGCPEGRYGLYCDKRCVCKNRARCHGFNGACECRPGWRGRACDIHWPEVAIIATPGDLVTQYIGTNLTLTCLAPHIQVANMTWLYQARNEHPNTTTTVEDGAVQNSSITFQLITESTNGEYMCGVKAVNGEIFNSTFVLNATECPPNHFGEVCRQVCDCQYGGTCDRWEGCLCPPGRHGDRCEIVPKPNGNHVVVKLLATVLPSMALLCCIVITIRIRRDRHRSNNAGNTDEDLEMEPLSPWEIEKENIRFEHMIGEGEFGHVVRGRLRVPEGYEVLVAAKCIRPDRMTALAVRDFRREMDILARIHEDKDGHPNVVKFYGVVTKSDPQYIVVEYAANEELRRYLWSLREERKITGSLKLLERLGFASDVASGLSELARLKIVHRDIAARNVVITGKKEAKIADFGLARDVYVSSAYARTQQGGEEEELLPLKWMAVESLRDGVYTCESDVWSYGVLLWEIASFGEEPRYAGGPMHPDVCTLLELLRKGVRLQQPQNCPMAVYRIIRSCWIVDPLKRPSPEELLRKIELLRPPRHAHWSPR